MQLDYGKMESIIEDYCPGTICIAGAIDDLQGELFTSEKHHVAGCVDKRRREFTAGRTAARMAMARLGFAPAEILVGQNKEPLWPPQVIGSISHTDDTCLCLVAPSGRYPSIGVDLEASDHMEKELADHILTANEQNSLATLPDQLQLQRMTAIFSAKESFFKYQFPLTGRLLEFTEMEIRLDPQHNRFAARDLCGNAVPMVGGIHYLEHKVLTVIR